MYVLRYRLNSPIPDDTNFLQHYACRFVNSSRHFGGPSYPVFLGWSSPRTDRTTFREGNTHFRNASNYFHQSAWQNSPNDFNLHKHPCQDFRLRLHLFLILSGAIAKLRKATISFVAYLCPYVCPQGKTLPLNISWNSIFQYFSKICQENSTH
jgi:hypothetical protein